MQRLQSSCLVGHARSAFDSYLLVEAVVVFGAHKTNYMCSNKRADQKAKTNKKTVEPIKTTITTTTVREAKQQDEQTANIKHDLLKCTQLFIGTGHGHRVRVGV